MKIDHGCVGRFVGTAIFLGCFFVSGCANLTASPTERADTLAQQNGFVNVPLQSGLHAYWRTQSSSATAPELTIYIEGDGAHWPRGLPPADPTPINPYALKLAIADTTSNVAYLGRACQYLPASELAKCPLALWTDARFGDDAITSMSRSIDEIKTKTKAKSLRLVGYSGGGTLALLVLAKRLDVSCLVTVAAPLDTETWAATLGVSPLKNSHNPALDMDSTSEFRQTHFQGGADAVVPPSTTLAFRSRHPTAKFVLDENYDHECCWDKQWAQRIAAACPSL